MAGASVERETLKTVKSVATEISNLKHQYRLQRLDTLTKRQQVQLAIITSMHLNISSINNPSSREELLKCSAVLTEEFLGQGSVKP